MPYQVCDWMSWPIVAVQASVLVREAEELMGQCSLSHLLVFRERHLVGVLCACDLQRVPADMAVAGCMASPPLTVLERTPIDDAAVLLNEARVGCLPVVAHGEVVGIVTRGDLRRAGAEVPELVPCVSCGARDHLRSDPRGTGLPYCLECLPQPYPLEGYPDLGNGD